jgi:parallel beta-helix repeat protein
MRKLSITAWAVATVLALVSSPQVALADPVNCGDVITADTTLEADLYCPAGYGLAIGANGVTLDLGGHTLRGELATSWPYYGVGIWGRNRVTIKNGTIENFTMGVSADGVRDLMLTNLVFRGPAHDQGIYEAAVFVLLSSRVVVQHSSFWGATPTGWDDPTGIVFAATDDAKVHNVDVHGYTRGVAFSCAHCDTSPIPSSGEVTDSTIRGSITGVTLHWGSEAKISNNHVSHCTPVGGWCRGIEVWRSTASVKHNQVHDNYRGILISETRNSEIFANHVQDNGSGGIWLVNNSTSNTIKSNLTSGNGVFDLHHQWLSTPNTWKDNSCETKDGIDIPDC